MRQRLRSCKVEFVPTITAIYDSIYYPYDYFNIRKQNFEEIKKYNEEKNQIINNVIQYLSNNNIKLNLDNFNLDGLNPLYLTNNTLKLIEELKKNGFLEEDIKIFILENCSENILKQFVDREEIININRERSLYLKQKFNK